MRLLGIEMGKDSHDAPNAYRFMGRSFSSELPGGGAGGYAFGRAEQLSLPPVDPRQTPGYGCGRDKVEDGLESGAPRGPRGRSLVNLCYGVEPEVGGPGRPPAGSHRRHHWGDPGRKPLVPKHLALSCADSRVDLTIRVSSHP